MYNHILLLSIEIIYYKYYILLKYIMNLLKRSLDKKLFLENEIRKKIQ
jgi:hypothetical protein